MYLSFRKSVILRENVEALLLCSCILTRNQHRVTLISTNISIQQGKKKRSNTNAQKSHQISNIGYNTPLQKPKEDLQQLN